MNAVNPLQIFCMSDHLIKNITPRPSLSQYLLVVVGYIALAVCLTLVAVGLFQWTQSGILRLNFDNLLNLRRSTAFALLLVSVLALCLFLLFQWIHQRIQRLALPISIRAAGMLLATFLTYGVSSLLLPADAALTVAVGLLIGLVLFGQVTDKKAPSFVWTMLALLFLSSWAATLLFQYNTAAEQVQRRNYAIALAEHRDTATAEPQLLAFASSLQQDAQLPYLLKPWPFRPSADTLRNHFSRQAWKQHYIAQHYRLVVYAFDRDQAAPLLLDQFTDRPTVDAAWNKAQPTDPTQPDALRIDYGASGAPRYWVRTRINRMNDASHPVDLLVAFEQQYLSPTQAYARLFEDQVFKQTTHLADYDYAVLNGKTLVAERGHVGAAALTKMVQPGQTQALEADGRTEIVCRSTDGALTAIVGRKTVGLVQWSYLAAVLFTLTSAWLFLLGGVLRWLPTHLTLLPSLRGSLARRIHFSNLAILAGGFTVIGALTFLHFSATEREKAQLELEARANSILTNLRLEAGDWGTNADSLRNRLVPSLQRISASLLVDADLYSAKGKLLGSSRDDLARAGVLPETLDAAALNALSAGTNQVRVNTVLAGQSLNTQFLPLRNFKNELLGYLGVPYRPDTRVASPEVSAFIGILALIYVSFLLLAAVITLVLARGITGPVNDMADKIKALQLEDRNQPLAYTGDPDDELGAMVGEYNRMVDKLEESKQRLMRLEREEAWREMARQIAHDIKNPLTAMKLSMQQLERVSSDPALAATYLKRTTTRMIEQIDSLAQTASEFSMFANLDIKTRADVTINQIVESVYDLFAEERDVDLSLSLPKTAYAISADKNHLLRVFNNLIINAIQAIPSDRRGRVNVSLAAEQEQVIVRIADNGGGIPPEIRDRVFEPNFTTKTTGSGLGLAICRKIIEAHGGTIWFETEDDKGTTFSVSLPIVAATNE
jgi:two-component system, NtrC family, nitrogen regulation sensor histidine kinase NtrY